MKYFLKSFSQDVSLERPDKALTTSCLPGRMVQNSRVPVQEDTIKELTKEVFKSESRSKKNRKKTSSTPPPEQFDEQDEPFESDSDDPLEKMKKEENSIIWKLWNLQLLLRPQK